MQVVCTNWTMNNIHLATFNVFRSSVLQPEAPQQQCCPQLITARRMVCMILLIVVVSWSLLPKPCRAHGPCLAWPDATGHKIVLALAEIGTGNTAVVPGIHNSRPILNISVVLEGSILDYFSIILLDYFSIILIVVHDTTPPEGIAGEPYCCAGQLDISKH